MQLSPEVIIYVQYVIIWYCYQSWLHPVLTHTFILQINPVGNFEAIWASQNTNSKAQVGIWAPSLDVTLLHSNKVLPTHLSLLWLVVASAKADIYPLILGWKCR